MQSPQLYFIAIICPEPLQAEITAIKNFFSEKYNCKVALKSPSHITLIPPFELKHHNEQKVADTLKEFKTNVDTLIFSIKKFGHFEKRTIFLQPEANDDIVKLHLELQHFLKLNLFPIKDNSHFNPHITVANRDLKPADFDESWMVFKGKEFEANFKSERFALLKLIEKKWIVVAEFKWND